MAAKVTSGAVTVVPVVATVTLVAERVVGVVASRIATAANNGGARVFDAATGGQQFALLGHGNGVRALDWGPDSTQVVTGSADGTAKVWSLLEGDGREMASLSAADTRLGVAGVAFSPDGSRVLTGGQGITSALVWDVGTSAGHEVANLPAVLAHPGAVEFSADGPSLLATAGGGSVGVWDAQTWASVGRVGGRAEATTVASGVSIGSGDDVHRLAADPAGKLVAVVRLAGEGSVEVWDVAGGEEAFVVQTSAGEPWFAWSPDGERLAVSDGAEGRLAILDRSGRELTHTSFSNGWVGHVAFTPDGDRVVTTVEPNGVAFWNWRTGEVDLTIETSADLAVPSPSGDLIAVAPHASSDADGPRSGMPGPAGSSPP
ncbi:MAG TPA: hypothetical protein VFP09_01390 [Desertimonas sp.]|nr:hypothetical protein [Desertimonas sp.]